MVRAGAATEEQMSEPNRVCPRCGNGATGAELCPECGFRGSFEVGSAPLAPGNGDLGLPARARSGAQPTFTVVDRLSDVWPAHVPRARRRAGSATRAARGGVPDLMSVLGGDEVSRAAVRREIAKTLLAMARGGKRLDRARRPQETAAAFLRRFEGRRLTQESYALDLADWFMWLGGARIHPFEATFATVESYAREPLEDGRTASPSTTSRRLACLAHFYRRALFAGLVDQNPVDQVQRPRVPEQSATLGLSKVKAQQLIEAARASGPCDGLLVLLMLELGLRVSEAVGARIEDLSDQGRHRVLRIRGKGQATKATIVPLNPSVIAAIGRATAGRSGGPLLINDKGLALSRQQAGRRVKALGEAIGVPSLHPHALRHAFVTLALDEGASLRDVQDGARHADPRTTRRYDRNRMNLDRHPTHLLGEVLEREAVR